MTYGTRSAPPKSGAMLEALRGLGYSAATALSDIIDNSIAAGAKNVDLTFDWAGPRSVIRVIDDGSGMTDDELDRAMRLGEIDPLADRHKDDLGRFGLGLKTASFSQARRLTVASRKRGSTCCLRWDLDRLSSPEGGDWLMLEGADADSPPPMDALGTRPTGTVVQWENPDRVLGQHPSAQEFLDLIDSVERHVAMVFHRYLEGSSPRLRIRINGRAVLAWDPFMSGSPATWTSPTVRLGSGPSVVHVVGHVLPHRDRLDPKAYELGAGADGWTAQQGFYVYRNARMLVAGGWLGIGRPRAWTKEEPTRLARIRLDLPNTADNDWKLDIRKSRARPPAGIRDQLQPFAEDIRARARRVFAHRGRLPGTTSTVSPVAHAWRVDHQAGGVRYRIDESHPAVRAVLDDAGPNAADVRAMLRVIEETVPVQRIWLDTAEGKDTPQTRFAAAPEAEVAAVLNALFRNLVLRKGMSPVDARARLLRTDPFDSYPTLVAALSDNPNSLEG